jgi:hypothetical protein
MNKKKTNPPRINLAQLNLDRTDSENDLLENAEMI